MFQFAIISQILASCVIRTCSRDPTYTMHNLAIFAASASKRQEQGNYTMLLELETLPMAL